MGNNRVSKKGTAVDFDKLIGKLMISKFTMKIKNKQQWRSDPFFAYAGGYKVCLRHRCRKMFYGGGAKHIFWLSQLHDQPKSHVRSLYTYYVVQSTTSMQSMLKFFLLLHCCEFIDNL